MIDVDRRALETAVPDTTGAVYLSGLEAGLTIFRDGWGIPHVQAKTIRDAFFGQGFATAQDRLWHMDADRRRAYGCWAELVGETAVAQDVMMRRFRIRSSVRNDMAALDEPTRAMLLAYAAGVNAFMDSTSRLPVEYRLVAEGSGNLLEPWQPWDSLAVFKARHILMGVFESKLWRARLVRTLGPEKSADLLRGYQPGHLLIVPPGVEYGGPALDGVEELRRDLDDLVWLQDGAEAGSNSWVLSGARTASGRPLLAGDPHRGLDVPNVYYQNHMACPEFDAVGLSFPGCPGFPHFGHNAHVAWCVTHAGADYQDLYIERFRETKPVPPESAPDTFGWQYQFRGDWRPVEVERATIDVRGGDSIEFDVFSTHHGPLIAGEPAGGHGIAFRYTATAEPNTGFNCLCRMLASTSADELEEAMREWVDPCNNFLFADVHGSIGYLNRGKVPVRPMANAWLPVPGWTGDYEWQGHIPFEQLVRSRNPSTGYIATANNRIAAHDYPHYIALDYAPDYRARRVVGRIKDMQRARVEDMTGVHGDRVSIPAVVFGALLAHIEPDDRTSEVARDCLSDWAGDMDPESSAPTIYSVFRLCLHELILPHLVGDNLEEMLGDTGRGGAAHLRQIAAQLVTMAGQNDPSWLPKGMSWEVVAARAFSEAVRRLRDRYGADPADWRWGLVHHTRPAHTLSPLFPDLAELLDPPAVPVGGDADTPQAASYLPMQPFEVTTTSVARYVFDMADWNNSRWIVPLGASGHPGSLHYADQAPVWARLELIPMLYGWDRIRERAESRQELLPHR
jgi:penicillin amidase